MAICLKLPMVLGLLGLPVISSNCTASVFLRPVI